MYELRRKDEYAYRSIASNQDAIGRYVGDVDHLNSVELAVGISFLAAAGAAILTYISSGLTAKQALAAAGVFGADAVAYAGAVDNCESTWHIYID